MRGLYLAVLVVMALVTGCSVVDAIQGKSPGDIGETVKQSMQQSMDTDPNFSPYDLRIVKVDVVKASGNEYNGIATVRTPKGSEHPVAVKVTADGEKVLWNTEPGAFLFAAQEQLTG